MPSHLRNSQQFQQNPQTSRTPVGRREPEMTTSEEEETDDEVGPEPATIQGYAQSQHNRPQSSLSSRQYRTPMASVLMTPPTHTTAHVPATQPMPTFETPSAFEGNTGSPSIPSSAYPTTTVSYPYPANLSQSSRTDITSPPNPYPAFRQQYTGRPYALQPGVGPRPGSRPVIERAVESVQGHLAALTERIEVLETLVHRSTVSTSGQLGARSSAWGRGSPSSSRGDDLNWDFDDMGMWSFVLKPLQRVFVMFEELKAFLARNENRSPTLVIVRRLFLDISFLLCVLAMTKIAWRKTGMRRREVYAALGILWRALVGHKRPRVLVDRAV